MPPKPLFSHVLNLRRDVPSAGSITTGMLAPGVAAGNFVGARQFTFAEFGRNSAAVFNAFLEPRTNATPLSAGQMCRFSIAGALAVGAGTLLLAVGTTAGDTLATPVPSLGVFGGGAYQLDVMIGAASATNYGAQARWRLWNGVSTPTVPIGGALIADNFSMNANITVTASGLRLAGLFSVANASSAVQVTWAFSEVL